MKPGRPLLVLLLVACAAPLFSQSKKDDPNQIGNREVGKGLNFYSLEKEIALGRQLAREVQRQAKIVDEPIIAEYVNRLGQNLVRNSDAKVPFTFRVIDNDVPNAFALPGGYVFVNTGLIELAEEEDELAGAIAHEIAHVAARHMTRRATKSEIASLATLPLSVLLPGWAGIVSQGVGSVAVPMGFLRFSRTDESEADYLGVQYLYAAGYDPTAVITVLEKLDALSHRRLGGVSRLFSTHPVDSDRIQKTQKEIQQILPPRDLYIVDTSDYHNMRERVFSMEARRKPEEQDTRPHLIRPSEAATSR
ncbi:MAG: M48 family metalloprotease [Acidobacteriia bacterium]|nr:M48 family metalloprotease [Terriglobia bacterium]